MIHNMKIFAFATLLCAVGCSATSNQAETSSQPISQAVKSDPSDLIVTVNTEPQGAECFLTGYEQNRTNSPGQIIIPAASKSKGHIVCNKDGFIESKSDLHTFVDVRRHGDKIELNMKLIETEN